MIGDLVPLLYRKHWIRFGMFGEIQTRTADAGTGAWEERGRLEVAPDGRYRAELTDWEGDRELLVGDGAPLSTARGAAGLALEIGRRWLIRNNPAEPGR
jgi:hypothetical protein